VVNFKKLADKAKEQIEKRGGTEALKQDADELKSIAKGKGSLKDKAKAAGEAIKDPGAPGRPEPARGGDVPKADEGARGPDQPNR